MTIAEDSHDNIYNFLFATFQPVDEATAQYQDVDMYKYATLAKFLSSSTVFESSAETVSKENSKIYLWQFLVDCFEGAEDYQTNIICKTFRCPQYTTENLRKLSTKCWLGEFLYARRTKGLKGSAAVPQGSHYSGAREVTMKPVHLSRALGQVENVYAKHKDTVFEKVIHDEIRPDRVKWQPFMH
jgi:hypothetical protein